MATQANEVALQSTITCPECRTSVEEAMPTDACQWFYESKNILLEIGIDNSSFSMKYGVGGVHMNISLCGTWLGKDTIQ